MLRVENLTCARGDIPVLSDVSFSVAAGQVFILRGPNGIGKTTLLRTIAGLQNPLEGQVIADEDIAYAALSDAIKPTLSVAENLSFWAAIYGVSEIKPALSAMNLETLIYRPAGSLSAGQRRRLGLARLLVTGSKIWALDEPTVSLDADSVALFAAAVTTHCAAGGAAVIATHIDAGLTGEVLDLTPYRAAPQVYPQFAGEFEEGVF